MSHSALVDHVHLSPNHSGRRNHSIDTITIHMVVGQCSVETLGNVFAPVSRQASANYGIGYDGRIGCYVEEENRSWCSSSAWNDHRAITIETASDNYYPYAINYEAYESLIELCADICRRNGKNKMIWYGDYNTTMAHIGEDSSAMYMTLHKWFAATGCPGEYLEKRMGEIARRVTAMLTPEPKADPEPEPTITFTDVDTSASYAKPVYWAAEKEIVKGYNDGTFRPENKCTRGQFMIMIWRMMDKPEAKKYVEFKDIAFFGSQKKAILWAAGEGIVKGYSSGYFGPEDPLTRAQAAVIIWRLTGKQQPKGKASSFSDVDTRLNSFKAIQWLAEQGILKGYSDGTFRPNDCCLRKHAVTILYRAAKLLK